MHRRSAVESITTTLLFVGGIDDILVTESLSTALEIARRTRRSSDAVESCHPRRTAICKRKSRMVTITEKKQKCNGDDSYRSAAGDNIEFRHLMYLYSVLHLR